MQHKQILEELIDVSYRTSIYKVILQLIICFFSFFAMFNMYTDSFSEFVVVEIVFSILSLLILLNFSKIKENNVLFQNLIRVYVCIISIFICFLFSYKFKHTVQLWLFCVPLMSYLLLGKKWGCIVTGYTYVFSIILFCIKHFSILHLLDTRFVANIICICGTSWSISHIYETKTHTAQLRLAMIAVTDHLTGLLNRSMLEKVFQKYQKNSMSLLIIDIDFFKQVNDVYGHEAGDYVLTEFAKKLSGFFKNPAHVFRIGGEEFCVLLPQYTQKCAKDMVTEFQVVMSNHKIEITHNSNTQNIHITFSAGLITTANNNVLNLTELLNVADQRLYDAKNNGRNKVVST